MMHRIHVLVAVIVNDRHEVLIQQRQAHQDFPEYWEFPGGKREGLEGPYEALQRELQEELGIHVQAATPWFELSYDYPQKSVRLDIWQVQRYEGVAMPVEGQRMHWCPMAALSQYPFLEANKIILDRLLDHASSLQ